MYIQQEASNGIYSQTAYRPTKWDTKQKDERSIWNEKFQSSMRRQHLEVCCSIWGSHVQLKGVLEMCDGVNILIAGYRNDL